MLCLFLKLYHNKAKSLLNHLWGFWELKYQSPICAEVLFWHLNFSNWQFWDISNYAKLDISMLINKTMMWEKPFRNKYWNLKHLINLKRFVVSGIQVHSRSFYLRASMFTHKDVLNIVYIGHKHTALLIHFLMTCFWYNDLFISHIYTD